MDLSVNIAGVRLKNPVLTASGCFSYGEEASEIYDISRLGGIVTKSLTYLPREGHPPPKVVETDSGMLNAIGLSNVGIDKFIFEKLPFLRQFDTACIVSIAGSRVEEYVKMTERLAECDGIAAIEANISCPNVDEGGLEFGAYREPAGRVIAEIKRRAKQPVIAKLSPNVTDIVEIAKSVVANGADAISLINTLVGTVIDIEKRSFKLSNKCGGLSGPAIRPVALAMVYKVANTVKVPVIGMGGIMTASDAVQFMLAGASAVEVGTACFIDPMAPLKIIDGLRDYLARHHEKSVKDIIGKVRRS
ncbi:MAG: dihydroorotate dehydrogenase B catalytic subunit [candidate division Zixibacteria bacterium RBG_16_53_22]|nr:MAG: dihydroorotate dehydrogenase B catalytic subunit [candidate division Zixibacteria bacterium RBG_16_53_22]